MRRVLLTLTIVGLLGTAGWWGLHSIPASIGYDLEAEFETVPPNDERLEQWLGSQPGVATTVVKRERAGARWRVEVIYVITRDGWGQPRLPDLNAAAAELGYGKPDGRFRDSPRYILRRPNPWGRPRHQNAKRNGRGVDWTWLRPVRECLAHPSRVVVAELAAT
jgi:hypothetical protein